MAPRAIVFALSNPDPEVHPDVAGRHALVTATGRSDFPNQINNSLAFPGIFRGALDVRATDITERMKLAAAGAIAALVGADAAPGYVIPSQFDERVAPARCCRHDRLARWVGHSPGCMRVSAPPIGLPGRGIYGITVCGSRSAKENRRGLTFKCHQRMLELCCTARQSALTTSCLLS
jgi:hypothetical protein